MGKILEMDQNFVKVRNSAHGAKTFQNWLFFLEKKTPGGTTYNGIFL